MFFLLDKFAALRLDPVEGPLRDGRLPHPSPPVLNDLRQLRACYGERPGEFLSKVAVAATARGVSQSNGPPLSRRHLAWLVT